jgi:hypothetical protein
MINRRLNDRCRRCWKLILGWDLPQADASAQVLQPVCLLLPAY